MGFSRGIFRGRGGGVVKFSKKGCKVSMKLGGGGISDKREKDI